jgi:hypothetical protein
MAPKRTVLGKKLASPRRIVVSEEEFSTGVTSLDNIQAGVEEFQTHGFVVLESAIANSIVDKLSIQMRANSATCLTFPDLVFNHGNEHNNFSMTPPLSDEFMFEDIWANKHATTIMQQIIGPKPLLCWASSNVAIPSGGHARQAVHSDAYADIPNFPSCVEMNIYLQDTTPENGSTEIWPGTHVFTEDDHLPHGRGWIKKKAFTDRARSSPPIQPTIQAGSILMRDLRLWHSGMPNTSQFPRIIIALLYFPQWFRPHMRLTLPASVRPKAEAWTHIDLLSNTDFVEGSVDHLRMRFPMNFTQDPAKGLVEYRTVVDRSQGREPGAIIPVTKDNYWTPSGYQTRAARKRGRVHEEDKREKKKKQKREEAESEVTQGLEIKQEVKVKQEHEFEQAQEPKIKHELELEQEASSKQDTKSVEDLPDYEDSPKQPPPRMVKLQESPKAAAERPSWDINSGDCDVPGPLEYRQYLPEHGTEATKQQEQEQKAEFQHELEVRHETEPKQDTKQIEDLPDYEDSPVYDTFPHLQEEEAQEQAAISVVRKQTFKLDLVPYAGPGPRISPQFSPKSKPESPYKPSTTQEPKATQKQQVGPVAKMTPDPDPQELEQQEHKLTQAPAWERDSRPYAGLISLENPSQAPSSSLSSPPLQRHPQPSAQPKPTDAYDAYIQTQLLEQQQQDQKRAELKKQRDEKRRLDVAHRNEKGASKQEQDGDGLDEGWMSYEDSQAKEWGW